MLLGSVCVGAFCNNLCIIADGLLNYFGHHHASDLHCRVFGVVRVVSPLNSNTALDSLIISCELSNSAVLRYIVCHVISVTARLQSDYYRHIINNK